jgi:tetratricopeptide (TPR) repeat protein
VRILLCSFVLGLTVFAQGPVLAPADRQFIETHFQSARSAEALQQYDQAAQEYDLIVKKFPKLVPRVYQNLGIVYFYQQKYEDAARAFESGVRLEPDMLASRLFLGRSYLAMQQPEKALTQLAYVHKQQPTFETALFLGQCHMARLQNEKAAAYFQTALSLADNQTKPTPLHLLGQSYLRMAEKIVNAQTQSHPESSHTRLAAARIFESQDRYQVSAIMLIETAQLDPLNASLFFPLARMLAILGQDEASRLAVERYRSLMPSDRNAAIDKSTLHRGRVAEIGTKVDFEGILRGLPPVKIDQTPPLPMFSREINAAVSQRLARNPSGRWKAVVRNLTQGELQQAVKAFDAFPATDTDWLKGYLKATAQMWLDNLPGAAETIARVKFVSSPAQVVEMLKAEIYHKLSLDYLNRLVADFPNSCPAHLVRGENLSAQGKPEAEGEFRAAIAACPQETRIRLALADFYIGNVKLEEALAECLKELELNPYSNEAKVRIGRIYVQLRDAEKGIPFLTQALRADPEDANARVDLARGYELLEQWEKAVEEYNRALKSDPSLNRVHYVLARLYRQLGRNDLAQKENDTYHANEASAREQQERRVDALRQRPSN